MIDKCNLNNAFELMSGTSKKSARNKIKRYSLENDM